MKKKEKYDVIVIGLGAMGSASVYQLAAKGAKVLGIDRFSPPHAFGSSSGNSRIVRQAYYEDKRYVPLLKKSYELWRGLELKSHQKLLAITGALMIGSGSDKVLEGSYASALQFNIPSELLNTNTIRHKFPQFRLDHTKMALLDHTAGFIHPENAIKVTLELAAHNGADLHTDEPVLSWESKRQGNLEIKTHLNSYLTDQLVICAGAWAKNLLPHSSIPLHVERVVQFWMQPIDETVKFTSPDFPVFLMAVEPDLALYGIPSEQPIVKGVKVALHPMGTITGRRSCDPDSVNREVIQKDMDQIRLYLHKYVPALNGKCLKSSVCLYTNTPDLHPVIDFYPENPKVVFAAGFSGHGFKFSNVVGEIVSDLVMKGKSDLQLDFFKIKRFITNKI